MSGAATTGWLAGIDATTLTAWRAEAQAALHALRTGAKVVKVGYAQGDGNRQVEYTPADEAKLVAHIADLNRALGVGTGRRAMAIGFG